MKECKTCQLNKDESEFYGRSRECKPCSNKRRVKWAKDNPEQQAQTLKGWKERNKKRVRRQNQEAKARHRKRHPDKEKARRTVARAIELGEIVKPKQCSRCTRRVRSANDLHAHHADYSKPLQVEWLCRKCHEQETSGADS